VLAVLFAAAGPSKTPWYIAGAVLAIYAVILAFIGLRSPEFPFGERGERGVIAVSVVLVVIALGAAILTG
jgi:hypothetical protein